MGKGRDWNVVGWIIMHVVAINLRAIRYVLRALFFFFVKCAFLDTVQSTATGSVKEGVERE